MAVLVSFLTTEEEGEEEMDVRVGCLSLLLITEEDEEEEMDVMVWVAVFVSFRVTMEEKEDNSC